MTKFIFTIVLFLTSTFLVAQDSKDLTISFGTGIFNSPYYSNAKQREFYNFDFDYHITNRHILSVNFLAGHHLYYDSILSNNAVPLATPGYDKNTNSTADYFVFSFLYKYRFVDSKSFYLNAGVGAGLMLQRKTYPYTSGNIVSFRESGWEDLVFPLKLEIGYKITKHFQTGVIGGLYIHPDYPTLGYHTGIRFGYVIK